MEDNIIMTVPIVWLLACRNVYSSFVILNEILLLKYQGKNQIMPIAWEIWDEKAFASVEQLNYLANRSRGVKESEYKTIAVWEHDRWVRWTVARGWLPASADDAVFAVKCGNERQQLFVAKLHPCICAYEGQKELKLALKNECGMDKDFYSYDMANIKDTKRLLAL